MVWTGLRQTVGTWPTWSDGRLADWSSGLPLNESTENQCAAMAVADGSFSWRDCNEQLGFICETNADTGMLICLKMMWKFPCRLINGLICNVIYQVIWGYIID